MNSIFLPRGIRNSNPGNIRLSKTKWQGQAEAQEDGAFVVFVQPVHGLRALMRTLLTYYLKYDLNTVESIMNRYAPPHENETDAYIHQVSRVLGGQAHAGHQRAGETHADQPVAGDCPA